MKIPTLAAAIAPALVLSACGGSGDSVSGETPIEAAAKSDAIGTIDATINGQSYSFIVPAERGVEEKEFMGRPTINITGMTRKDDGSTGMPYITLMVQEGSISAENVGIVDGSMMHQLTSPPVGGNSRVTFETRESGGPYVGSFEATLQRDDANSMPEDVETMFEAPVEVSGTFEID